MMKTSRLISLFAVAIAGCFAASCSTTRVLADGEYRLERNEIKVENGKLNTSSLSSYVKQQPSWSPMLYVYNWSNPKSESGFNRFLRRIGTAPVVFQPDLVDASAEGIGKHLEYLGYYGSNVTPSVSTKHKKARVKYLISLGRQFTIDSVTFSLPLRGEFAADFLSDTANVTIRPGMFLSEVALEEESERSASVMRTKGYYNFTKNHYFFEADTLTLPGKTILEMSVREYIRNESPSAAKPISRFYLDSITIEYPKSIRFKESVLRDLTTLHPGMMYNEDDVNATYKRLSSLRNFSAVGVEMTQCDTNKVDCAIRLSSSPQQGFKVNLETSVNSTGLISVSPQLTFFHKNIFGGGERLNLGFLGNFQFMPKSSTRANEFGVTAGLSFPRFLGLPYSSFKGTNIPGTEISMSYNYQDRPEYRRNIFSTSYGYSGSTRSRMLYKIYPLQISVVNMGALDKDFEATLNRNPSMLYTFMDHFDAGVGGDLYWSSSTEPIPTSSYHYYRASLDLSGNVFSMFNKMLPMNSYDVHTIFGIPYSQYARCELTFGKTWRLGANEDHALATRVQTGIGYAYGNSTTLPYEKQFYVGGANSMRGWQARALGPGKAPENSMFVIPSQTGDLKFEANIEYRFPLFWKLEGALFVDAGNIWTAEKESFKSIVSSIAMDWGPGVRVNLGFLIARIDLGVKLLEPSRETPLLSVHDMFGRDGMTVHFGVGYPF